MAARRETSAKLIESGMSQREASKVLGVLHSTVQADLGRKSAKSGGETATKADRRAQREMELASKQTALPLTRLSAPAPLPSSPRRRISHPRPALPRDGRAKGTDHARVARR
jgi:transposase